MGRGGTNYNIIIIISANGIGKSIVQTDGDNINNNNNNIPTVKQSNGARTVGRVQHTRVKQYNRYLHTTRMMVGNQNDLGRSAAEMQSVNFA